MAKRRRLETTDNGMFFEDDARITKFSSGCGLLDEVLGGGWAENRVINIVGDRSTGKTLLAIEAAANFHRKYPKGKIYYAECEAAFDIPYASSVGLPAHAVELNEECDTVEDFYEYLMLVTKKGKPNVPKLVFLDSLDALSDRKEMERDLDKGTYGANKAKMMSQLFRRMIKQMAKTNTTLIIVSQVRDKIGVIFGDTNTRSGGRALDFYSTQIMWLAKLKALKQVKKKVERHVGVMIRARNKKNKAGTPFRECDFPIMYHFGVDDVRAGLDFLDSTSRLGECGLTEASLPRYKKQLDDMPMDEYTEQREIINTAVRKVWREIEISFRPKRSKYGV